MESDRAAPIVRSGNKQCPGFGSGLPLGQDDGVFESCLDRSTPLDRCQPSATTESGAVTRGTTKLFGPRSRKSGSVARSGFGPPEVQGMGVDRVDDDVQQTLGGRQPGTQVLTLTLHRRHSLLQL